MKKPESYAIGVDLGGTFIKAGVVALDGKIIYHASRPTEVAGGRDVIVANIAAAAEGVMAGAGLTWSQVVGVGIGSPGIFDYEKGGLVCFAPNLKPLEGCILPQLVQGKLTNPKVHVILENDANAAAYGEKWVGMGHEVESLVLFTLGTGVGGGIVLNSDVWHGSTGFAGELGHMTILPEGPKCGCGNFGCIEALSSATALVRRLNERIASGAATALATRVKAGERVTAQDIYLAAVDGDKIALELMAETGKYLGIAVASMINVLNPEMVVFSGGMTSAGDMLLQPIKDEAKRRAIRVPYENCRIVFSNLGNDAGLIGAAGCVLKASGTFAS